MTIRRPNPRKQGEIGLGAAVAWFTSNGYVVSIPLADNQPYDLVVDDGERLLKVQVKTTTRRGPRGDYEVGLRTAGGNQSFTTVKRFDKSASDLLFILTDSWEIYVIPCAEIQVLNQLNLCEKYRNYRKRGLGQPPTGATERLRFPP